MSGPAHARRWTELTLAKGLQHVRDARRRGRPGPAPAQAGSLNLTNVRTTYGELGAAPHRQPLPARRLLLPRLRHRRDLTVSPEGKVSYAMMVEVNNKAGQVRSSSKTSRSRATSFSPLGGNRLPGRAYVFAQTGPGTGQYTCKVTVTDRVTKAIQDAGAALRGRQKGIRPDRAGDDSYDAEGAHAGPADRGRRPELVTCTAVLIGFGRGADKKPNTSSSYASTTSQSGRRSPKPLTAVVPKDIPPTATTRPEWHVPGLPLNREGNFTAELKAIDATTGKTATVTFPIRVLPPHEVNSPNRGYR